MYNNLKKRAREVYYCNILTKCKQDVKGTWKVLRPLIGKQRDKNNVMSDFIVNDVKVSDHKK